MKPRQFLLALALLATLVAAMLGSSVARAADWSEEFTGGFSNSWIFADDVWYASTDQGGHVHEIGLVELAPGRRPVDRGQFAQHDLRVRRQAGQSLAEGRHDIADIAAETQRRLSLHVGNPAGCRRRRDWRGSAGPACAR